MKNLKSLVIGTIALSSIYASISLATYTVTITNRSPCHISYSFGGNSGSSYINAGTTASLSGSEGQQVNLYMYTSLTNSYPMCGYLAATASISLYYDSAQQTYVEKVQQGMTISGSKPYYQNAILNGTTYIVNGGQTVQKNVQTGSGVIKTTVYGGNIK